MKRAATFYSFLLVSCSNTFVPNAAQLRELEQKLRAEHCIGDLAQWGRTYWIDPSQTEVLRFSLGRPTDRWTKGVRIIPSHRWHKLIMHNDAPMVAEGRYEIATGKVTMEFCGGSEAPSAISAQR